MSSGRIVQIIGAVIDVEFPRDAVPRVFDALKVQGAETTLEVQQQLGDGVVRTIAWVARRPQARPERGQHRRGHQGPGRRQDPRPHHGRPGNPIDEAGPIGEEERWEIHRKAPSYAEQGRW